MERRRGKEEKGQSFYCMIFYVVLPCAYQIIIIIIIIGGREEKKGEGASLGVSGRGSLRLALIIAMDDVKRAHLKVTDAAAAAAAVVTDTSRCRVQT